MAPPQAEAQAARNAAIKALALQQLAGVWPQVDWESPQAVEAVKRFYRAVVTRYGQAAASVAAEFYDQRRAEQGFTQRFSAAPADPLPEAVLDRVVESAFRGAAAPEPVSTSELPLEQRVPARLEGKVQRHVQQAGRDTIAANSDDDQQARAYIRVPRGAKTCAFCVMLASRAIDVTFSGYGKNSVKVDPETGRSVHVVTGRGRTPVASRSGKRQLGEKYHDHCDCEPVPLFRGQDEWDVSPNFGDYQDMYYKAAADAGTYKDPKAILASMRQLYGVK